MFTTLTQAQKKVDTFSFSIKEKDQTYLFSPLLIDHKGHLWYATKDGVYVHYGVSKKFIPLKNFFLPTRNDKLIFQDKNHTIWVGSSIGLYKINYQDFSYKFIPINSKKDYINILSFSEETNSKAVWVSYSNNRLYKIENNSIAKIISLPKQNEQQLFNLKRSPKGHLMAFGKNAIYRLENDRLINTYTKKHYENILIDINLSKKVKDKIQHIGVIYDGQEKISYKYLKKDDLFLISAPKWNINRAKKIPAFRKRLSYKNNIIYLINRNKKSLIQKEFYVENNVIKLKTDTITSLNRIPRFMTINSNKEILLGYFHQIKKIKTTPQFYKHYLKNLKFQLSAREITKNSSGDIFVSTYSGVFQQEKNKNYFSLYYEKNKDSIKNRFFSMLWQNDSILWGVQDQLYRINHSSGKKKSFRISPYSNAIAQKDSASFWIGSVNGLTVFDIKTKKNSNHNQLNKEYSLENVSINNIIRLPKNWVAFCTKKGLYLYQTTTKSVKHYTNQSKEYHFPHTSVLDVYQDASQNIWVTGNAGLSYITSSGQVYTYQEKDGLSHNNTCTILGNDNYLLVSSYNGINLIDLKFLKKNLTISTHMKGVEFNYNSKLKLNDSIFYFGSVNGVYKINSNKIPLSKHPTRIHPINIKKYDQNIERNVDYFIANKPLKSIHLSFANNYFELQYYLTNTFNPNNNDFQYKIDGLTNTWIDLNQNSTLRQYGIPPGNYTLYIKGKNDSGYISQNQIKIPIYVSQIFYKTTPFIISALFFSIFSIVIYFYRQSVHRKKQFALLNTINDLKVNALKTQMNPHFIFNAINGLQSDMMLRPITEVNDYISSFSKILRTVMNMSLKNDIVLREEINYLEAYIKLQQIRFNHDFEYNILVHDPKNKIDTVEIPCMLIQPIIENAIIHGLGPKKNGNKKLTLTFQITNNLIIGIEDNGVGIRNQKNQKNNTKKHAHALSLIDHRILLINEMNRNDISIETIKNDIDNDTPYATKVILKFPL